MHGEFSASHDVIGKLEETSPTCGLHHEAITRHQATGDSFGIERHICENIYGGLVKDRCVANEGEQRHAAYHWEVVV